MEAIISWSNVENFLLGLYIELLGGQKDRAAVAYLAIETQSAKTAAINAVAQHTLSPDNQRLLRAILKAAKTNQKSRDKLAHWIWGYSPDVPDGLLLANPKDLAGGDFDKEHIYVFNERDFSDLIASNDAICGYGLSLRFILMDHVANRDGRLFRELCQELGISETEDPPASPDQ